MHHTKASSATGGLRSVLIRNIGKLNTQCITHATHSPHGARLRLARRAAVLGGPCAPPVGPPGAGFDPARLDHFDLAQVPLARGPPQGQRTRGRGGG